MLYLLPNNHWKQQRQAHNHSHKAIECTRRFWQPGKLPPIAQIVAPASFSFFAFYHLSFQNGCNEPRIGDIIALSGAIMGLSHDSPCRFRCANIGGGFFFCNLFRICSVKKSVFSMLLGFWNRWNR